MTLSEWLQDEPFTLCLSVSLFGYWAHFGVIAALLEADIRPQRITGTSGGAIAATMYSKGYSVNDMLKLAAQFEFHDMLEFRPRLHQHFPYFGLFDVRINKLREKLFIRKRKAPQLNASKKECPISLSVYNKNTADTDVLTNCDASLAMAASASVPILVNDTLIENVSFTDGGVSDPHGLSSCTRGERILSVVLSDWCDYYDTSQYMNLRVLKIRDLPTIFPSCSIVNNGYFAYIDAYLKTKKALQN